MQPSSQRLKFEEVFQEFESKGLNPKFDVTDNQATKPIKFFLAKANCTWQFPEPHNHSVNAAEKATQAFKKHFSSGICAADEN